MVKINLLPLILRKNKKVIEMYTYAVISSSIVITLMILLFLNLWLRTHKIKNEQQEVIATIKSLSGKIEELKSLTEQEKEVTKKQELLDKMKQEQIIWIYILDELADKVREDMWLTSLKAERLLDKSKVKLLLKGRTYNKLNVPDFLAALEKSDTFKKVTLKKLNEIKINRQVQAEFEIELIALKA